MKLADLRKTFISSLFALVILVSSIAPAPAFAFVFAAPGVMAATAAAGALWVGLASIFPGLNPINIFRARFCENTETGECSLGFRFSSSAKPETPEGWTTDEKGDPFPPALKTANQAFLKDAVISPTGQTFASSGFNSCAMAPQSNYYTVPENGSCTYQGSLYLRYENCLASNGTAFVNSLTAKATGSVSLMAGTWVTDPTLTSLKCPGGYPYMVIAKIVPAAACAAGYVPSNGYCHLFDANQVKRPENGSCDLITVNGSYAVDPKDSDCENTAILQKFKLTPNSVYFAGDNYSASVVKDDKGHVTISSQKFLPASDSTTITKITGLEQADGSVLVQTQSSVAVAGKNLDSVAVASASNTEASSIAASSAGVNSGGSGSNTPPFTMPCGIAGMPPCDVTVAPDTSEITITPQLTDAITNLDNLQLHDIVPTPSDIAAHTPDGTAVHGTKIEYPGFFEWAKLGSDGCFNPPSFRFNFLGVSYELDGCKYWAPVKPSIAYLFSIITCFVILQIFMAAGNASKGGK